MVDKSHKAKLGTANESCHENTESKKNITKKKENNFLMNISDDKLENFYKYQYFNLRFQETKLEWDSIWIIPESKSIVNIEVKLGPKEEGNKYKLLEDASHQTEKHFNFFQKLFRSVLPKGWNFVKAACVPYLDDNINSSDLCVYCDQFIMKEKDLVSLVPWTNMVFNSNAQWKEEEYKLDYENLLAAIIGYASLKETAKLDKLIVSPTDLSKDVEKAITGNDIGITGENEAYHYMLNNEQLNAVKHTSTFLIINGDYGTGKTFVLKERARMCALSNNKSNVIFITLTAIQPTYNKEDKYTKTSALTVMDVIATKYFAELSNVKVVNMNDLSFHVKNHKSEVNEEINTNSTGSVIVDVIRNFLKHNPCDHLFIDELPFPKECMTLPKVFSMCETTCITLKVDDIEHKKLDWWFDFLQYTSKAVHINLKWNMRNSENIVNIATAFTCSGTKLSIQCLMPKKNVIGNLNHYYKNTHHFEIGCLAVAAINKYFPDDLHCSIVVLLEEYNKQVYHVLKDHFADKRQVFSMQEKIEVHKYWERPEGIFVTDIASFNGAQARNVIVFPGGKTSIFNIRNIILRTMAYCIVITNDNITVHKVPGLDEDKNLHEYIYVEDKPLHCHHFHNNHNLNVTNITKTVFDKYLNDFQDNLVIFTYNYAHSNNFEELKEYFASADKVQFAFIIKEWSCITEI